MKKLLIILLAAIILTGCQNRKKNSYTQVSMSEAIEIMNRNSGYIILDVRRPDEYSEGHIPCAINIANETIDEHVADQLADRDQLILVYCRSGNRSKQAAEKLFNLGYTNIVEFGGIIDWPGPIEK